ncbi:hypothetical protein SLA2020_222590 [Shorea laevis]
MEESFHGGVGGSQWTRFHWLFPSYKYPPTFSSHSHQPTPTSPPSIISNNNNKLPPATERLQWSLSRPLLCVRCCCVNFISFRFLYPVLSSKICLLL